MMTSLHWSAAFSGNKMKRKGKKVPLKRWNSQNRFFQPRSGLFSTDTLKCWVIVRQPTSHSAWLRLIQSHSVYETQWYGHNTQHSSALLKPTQLDIMFKRKMNTTGSTAQLRNSSFFCNVSLFWLNGSLTGCLTHFLKNIQTLLDSEDLSVGSTIWILCVFLLFPL